MNFENISTRLLENNWTKVEFIILSQDQLFKIHCALNQHKSRGRFNDDERFVMHENHMVLPVWFELEEDATYFALKWYTV